MFAVSLVFSALKMLVALLSGKGVMKCRSEDTTVRQGMALYLCAVSRILGSIKRASRNVETTLTVTVLSLSSTKVNFDVIMPAFSSRTSTLCSSFVARAANSLTLS